MRNFVEGISPEEITVKSKKKEKTQTILLGKFSYFFFFVMRSAVKRSVSEVIIWMEYGLRLRKMHSSMNRFCWNLYFDNHAI